MPPKPKFTREEIIQAALTIVSQKGADALTAREVGEQLGSSARPIFTVFKNMEELQAEVRQAAMERFEARVAQTEPGIPLFKQVGIQMVTFGVQEPKLYQLLFVQEHGEAATFDDVFGQLGGTAERCIAAICRTTAWTPRTPALSSRTCGSTPSALAPSAPPASAASRQSSWGRCSLRSFRLCCCW